MSEYIKQCAGIYYTVCQNIMDSMSEYNELYVGILRHQTLKIMTQWNYQYVTLLDIMLKKCLT